MPDRTSIVTSKVWQDSSLAAIIAPQIRQSLGTQDDLRNRHTYKIHGNLLRGLISEQVSVNDTESQIVELDIRNLNGFQSNRRDNKSLLNVHVTHSESLMHTKQDSASNLSHHIKVYESNMPTQDKEDVTADIVENEGHISSKNVETMNPAAEHKTSPSASYFIDQQLASAAGSASSRK